MVLTHVVATPAQETQPGIGLDIKVNSGEHIQGEAFKLLDLRPTLAEQHPDGKHLQPSSDSPLGRKV